MSRSELHGIVANLRAYLEWHAEVEPELGVPAAPTELVEAFAERKRAREQARLEAARNALGGDESRNESRSGAGEPAVSTTPNKPEQRKPEQRKPEQRKPEQREPATTDPGDNKPWVKYGPRSRKTFGAAESSPPDKTAARASAPSEKDQPPAADYDGPPIDEPDAESYEAREPSGPVEFGYPPHGAGSLQEFDASKFGWHGGKFRSPPEPNAGFSPADKLAILRMYLGDCTRCGLCEGRTNIVFGDGRASARLMFVGEGPGYNEDKQAKPFVGKAGQLLDKMINAMGFARDEVYIANVVKCRPPDNRDPAPDEVVTCSPFLHKQIAAISPDVIVTLGRFAAQNLLGVDTPISRMRGEWHEFENIPVMPTWHPAYLLRNESEKGNAWSDLQKVMARLGD